VCWVQEPCAASSGWGRQRQPGRLCAAACNFHPLVVNIQRRLTRLTRTAEFDPTEIFGAGRPGSGLGSEAAIAPRSMGPVASRPWRSSLGASPSLECGCSLKCGSSYSDVSCGRIAAVPLPSQGVRKLNIRLMGGLRQTRTFGGLTDIFQLGHFPVGKSEASARQAQRTFARPENHGLENAGSVCHAEAEIIGGVP
jgi:hypothetical protein